MTVGDLRQKQARELEADLLDLRRKQFNLRVQRATGQVSDVSQFRKLRRQVARVKTVLREKFMQD